MYFNSENEPGTFLTALPFLPSTACASFQEGTFENSSPQTVIQRYSRALRSVGTTTLSVGLTIKYWSYENYCVGCGDMQARYI